MGDFSNVCMTDTEAISMDDLQSRQQKNHMSFLCARSIKGYKNKFFYVRAIFKF